MRLNNRGKYKRFELNDYVESKGIVFQSTVAYSPESNKVAERINRTLIANMRAILINAKLSTYL
jgi:hypothetical protein